MSIEVRRFERIGRKIAPGNATVAKHAGTIETPSPAATNRIRVGNCGATCTISGWKPASRQQRIVRS
jgi:hypothetical protein